MVMVRVSYHCRAGRAAQLNKACAAEESAEAALPLPSGWHGPVTGPLLWKQLCWVLQCSVVRRKSSGRAMAAPKLTWKPAMGGRSSSRPCTRKHVQDCQCKGAWRDLLGLSWTACPLAVPKGRRIHQIEMWTANLHPTHPATHTHAHRALARHPPGSRSAGWRTAR